MKNLDVIHVGYASTESNLNLNNQRGDIKLDEVGVSSVLDPLKIFADAAGLENLQFRNIAKRLKENAIQISETT